MKKILFILLTLIISFSVKAKTSANCKLQEMISIPEYLKDIGVMLPILIAKNNQDVINNVDKYFTLIEKHIKELSKEKKQALILEENLETEEDFLTMLNLVRKQTKNETEKDNIFGEIHEISLVGNKDIKIGFNNETVEEYIISFQGEEFGKIAFGAINKFSDIGNNSTFQRAEKGFRGRHTYPHFITINFANNGFYLTEQYLPNFPIKIYYCK